MVTKVWKVYGRNGHRQSRSFYPSSYLEIKDRNVIIYEMNSDVTGTNEYTLFAVTAENEALAKDECRGQISDGVFENANVGRREEVPLTDEIREIMATIPNLRDLYKSENESKKHDISEPERD